MTYKTKRGKDQSETVIVTPEQIIRDPAFAAGVEDVRTGRPTRFDQFEVGNMNAGGSGR